MKLLLIEDDQGIADFIIKGFHQSGFLVDHADNGSEGLERASSEPYSVLIVDVMLPSLDGLDLVRRLRSLEISTPVLFLSAKREVDDRVLGLQAGGDDYLTKPFAFSELLARVQALVRRASGAPTPTRLFVGDLSLNMVTREVMRGGEKIDLPPLEFDLLRYLMENAGRIVSKNMIIEHVWNYNFDPATSIVETRICKLREKIDRPGLPRLIHTVRGVGYVTKSTS